MRLGLTLTLALILILTLAQVGRLITICSVVVICTRPAPTLLLLKVVHEQWAILLLSHVDLGRVVSWNKKQRLNAERMKNVVLDLRLFRNNITQPNVT